MSEGSEPATTTPRVLVGRYQIGELIGRGGMAEVHAGWDTRLGREVAIKVLRSELARDATFLQRFRREAQSAAALNHPSIVAVYDSGEDRTVELGGADLAVPFIVMEYVHGRTLREVLYDHGEPLEPDEACRIMAATLRALAFSHANGLIHRDIKPANVMVTDDGQVKLTDFGIARAIADSASTLTNTSVVVGTAQYLSPEQAQGRATDARADVYASGCVLYELLTGRPPFMGDSPLAIAYQQVGQAPEPPSTHQESLSHELDAVLLHALAKKPDERYRSAGEFAADLEAIAAGRRPSARALATIPAAGQLGDPGADPGTAELPQPDGAGTDGDGPEGKSDTSTLPAVTGASTWSRRRIVMTSLAAVMALLLLVVGVWAQGSIGGGNGVTVPDVRQKTLSEAKDALSQIGLATDVRMVPNTAPQGVVVRQSPEPGEEADPNSRVKLEVSSGPGNVELPDLTNYSINDAESMLRDRKLVYAIEYVDSFEIYQNNVVSTDPKAGTTVKEGSTVKLQVSTGKVTVPDLRGKSESDARSVITKYALRMAVTYSDSGGSPGTVIANDYIGVSVPWNTEVKVTVVREQPRPIPTTTVTRTVIATPQPPAVPTVPSPTPPPSPTATITPLPPVLP
ncbi:Serine/threonine-protein kinase PknB [Austwickia sp. TVS 96-490-7B]|uniref:Stk1 family PASTA domain-containing Ser/Thr kinase n=1 Tax=Austwickia sp. TVS 96-490-7B TaxID=2830843 RepID=UPI001C569300|nr:Stk1 family PASTA domain-containing Ser/Thr kinase [Austwickia sp. TVS 96-490-7B]MBW3084219.1 Serine/threonine-protein kinase PknB [Austwickia sp. TVS 96-490-7B]